MKFSPLYLTMVAAAAEIQVLCPRIPKGNLTPDTEEIGALYRLGSDFECLHYDNDTDRWMIGGYSLTEKDVAAMVWIPRLDDLLGMLGRPDDLLTEWMDMGGDISVSTFYHGDFQFNPEDWHESALLLIMHRRYGKAWDGKEWRAKP